MSGQEPRLPGAVVGRDWQTKPMNEASPPKEWVIGLWALDGAVQDAIRGGWSDEEVMKEVETLLCSWRRELADPEFEDER